MIRRISPTNKLLSNYFREGCKDRRKLRIGMEVEHLCVNEHDGSRIPYTGKQSSIESILDSLLNVRAGEPILEKGNIIGIRSKGGNITLEPGGQIEWSSPACADLLELSKRLQDWLTDFRNELRNHHATTIDTGLDVGTSIDEIPWVPKHRYELMRRNYASCPTVNFAAMANTASVHVALDYRNKADWQQKFRAMLLLTPIVTAIFGNSPDQVDGIGYQAWRSALWTMIDPQRCQPPAVAFNPAFGIDDWANWVADVPEILELDDGELQLAAEVPFRTTNKSDPESLKLHLSSIFTPVRTKQFLEVRTADMQTDEYLIAVPAFWYGLLYSKESLASALRFLSFINNKTIWNRLNVLACRFGLRHDLLRSVSGEMVQLALNGLRSNPEKNAAAITSLSQFARRAFAEASNHRGQNQVNDMPRSELARYFEHLKSSVL